jgi:hypothetical protein
VRLLASQEALDALSDHAKTALTGAALVLDYGRHDHGGRSYEYASLPMGGPQLAEVRRILREARAHDIDEEDLTDNYIFGRRSFFGDDEPTTAPVSEVDDGGGRIVGVLAQHADRQIERYRTGDALGWIPLGANTDFHALGVLRGRLHGNAEPTGADRAWLDAHAADVSRGDLAAFAGGMREGAAAREQEEARGREAYERQRAEERRQKERRPEEQLRDVGRSSRQMLVYELERMADAFPELRPGLLLLLRRTPGSAHEDTAESERDEPETADLRDAVKRAHRQAGQLRRKEEDERRRAREAAALRMVRAGADLKPGAPVSFEEKDGYVWVTHVLHDGRTKTAMVGWDGNGPFLFEGGKWRYQPSERRPDGFLARDR